MRRAPGFEVPLDELPSGVDACPRSHDRGRAVRLVRVLVRPGPLEQDRPPGDGTCQQAGLERDVVGAVVPVAARPADVNRPHELGLERERLRERGPEQVHGLRVRPDGERPVAPLRKGGRRPERRVHLVGTGVRPLDGRRCRRRLGPLGNGALDGHAVDNEVALCGLLQQPCGQLDARRQRRLLEPTRRAVQRLETRDGLLLALGHDAGEAPVAHDRDDAGERLRTSLVELGQPRRLAGGLEHACMEETRRGEVLDEASPPGDELADLVGGRGAAHDGVGLRRLRRRVARDRDAEASPAQHLPVGRRPPVRSEHRAVVDSEVRRIDLESLGGEPEEVGSGLRGRLLDRRPAVGQRHAAGGDPLVGAVLCVGGPHDDAGQAHVELLRGYPCHRAGDALAELRLARRDGDRRLVVDPDPGVEVGVALQARREGRHPRSRAARRTARTIRGCVPQRQR